MTVRCALVFIFLLSGFSAEAAPYVVGTWYGQGQPEDRHQMWLEHMLPNGAYDGLYRTCIKGKALDVFQTGSWSLDKDWITIRLSTVNGYLSSRTDLYQTLSQGGKKWTYRYPRLGFVYSAERVDDSFKLFSCEAIS